MRRNRPGRERVLSKPTPDPRWPGPLPPASLPQPSLPPASLPPGPRPPGSRSAGPQTLTPLTPRTQSPEPLWRHLLGERIRATRLERGETLAETARRAGISPQYLSEIERGRKEPSSELIAAVAGALDTTLLGLTEQVADVLRGQLGAATTRSFTARACAATARGPAFTLRAPTLALAA